MPPSASSRRPGRAATAPVNAPRSWPKSSASTIVSGIAAQLVATNGPWERGEPAWSALATSSLPVPVSPSTSTFDGADAMRSMRSRNRFIASLEPISACTPRLRSWTSRRRSRRVVAAFSSTAASSAASNGLVRKSKAPRRIASTALAISPCAVSRITGRSGCSSCRVASSCIPSTPGMRRSVMTAA